MLKNAMLISFAAACAACTSLPRAEFQAYREAFVAAETAAAPISENYAVRERAEWRRRLAETRSPLGFFETFEAEDATLLSSLGLPPGADASDRAFRALARYNDMLVSLAENRNIEEARGQLRQITSELTSIAAPLGSAQIPLDRAADVVLAIFNPIIQEDNRQQFRLRVLEGHDEMIALVGVLRDLAPHQYQIITRPLQDRARLADPADRAPIATEINAWHQVFIDYVFLLDSVEDRLNLLEQAARNPRSAPILARSAAGAADLRAYADGLRRSVTALLAPR